VGHDPDELAARRRVEEGPSALQEGTSGGSAAVARRDVAPQDSLVEPGAGGGDGPGGVPPDALERAPSREAADEVVAAGHRVELAVVLADFAQDLLVDFNVEQVLRHLCERLPALLPIDGAGVSCWSRTSSASPGPPPRTWPRPSSPRPGRGRDPASTRSPPRHR
jgi:hypothetical protein